MSALHGTDISPMKTRSKSQFFLRKSGLHPDTADIGGEYFFRTFGHNVATVSRLPAKLEMWH